MNMCFIHKSLWEKCAQKIVLLSKRSYTCVCELAKECKLQSAFFPNLFQLYHRYSVIALAERAGTEAFYELVFSQPVAYLLFQHTRSLAVNYTRGGYARQIAVVKELFCVRPCLVRVLPAHVKLGCRRLRLRFKRALRYEFFRHCLLLRLVLVKTAQIGNVRIHLYYARLNAHLAGFIGRFFDGS